MDIQRTTLLLSKVINTKVQTLIRQEYHWVLRTTQSDEHVRTNRLKTEQQWVECTARDVAALVVEHRAPREHDTRA
jgi:hypothetical protein